MSDLISRSAVLAKMDELIDFAYRNEDDDLHHTLVTVCSYIDEMPTIDAVPVVRCKDCKHARYSGIKGYVKCSEFEYEDKPNDGYCSYGEKEDI